MLLKTTLLGADFPWYLNSSKVIDNQESIVLPKHNYQFTHLFYDDSTIHSSWFRMLAPLVASIMVPGKATELVRIKANLLPATHDTIIYDYHTDIDNFDGQTAVFYVNTNDGFTIFEDGTKIDSIENRLLTFNSTIMHTGTSCTDQRTRCVINLNYINK